MITELFLILFIGTSILVVVEKDLIRALVFLAAASIFLTILTYLYRAPDVALTFTIVNSAGITVLFLSTIKKLERSGYERENL